MMTAVEFHEVANVFPLMEGVEFNEFRDDIRTHGLKEPIWLHDGKIIDGRNRYRACQSLGIAPDFREWNGKGDLTAFVVSLNLHRRHLTESQRGVIAARIKGDFERQARTRQAHGSTAPGKHSATNGQAQTLSANLREALPAASEPVESRPAESRRPGYSKASEQAAALLNVSPRSVEAASRVLQNGTPELVRAVEKGEVKVSAAEAVSTLPKAEQTFVLSQGPDAVREKAKQVRESRQDPLAVVMQSLFGAVSGIDSPKDYPGGWGGFEEIYRSKPNKQRRDTRNQLEHIVERLQGWLSIADRIERETA